MKQLITALLLALLLISPLDAQTRHQAGAAGSGRARSGTLRLDSVVGQSVSGAAGDLTSGFLSDVGLHTYIAGDVDGNGFVNISDAVFLITYIFGGGPAPANRAAADADCSGIITISDAVYLISYIFAGGPRPHYCP